MPLGSVEYENITYRCFYGDDRSALAPASFTVHLCEGYTDDPVTGERTWTELEEGVGGYVPPTVANTTANFPLPDAGVQEMLYAVINATGGFSAPANYTLLKDPNGVVVEWTDITDPNSGEGLTVVAAGEVRVPFRTWHYDPEKLGA